ncbi:MAG: type II toxin-antitoxin system Phd/YefM family antitoxin [Limisphaerales bacterium]
MAAITVGVFEAKTKLSELLDQVSSGAEITITRHDTPIARLVPVEKPKQTKWAEVFRMMDDFAANHPLNPSGQKRLTYRDLIEGGRKR